MIHQQPHPIAAAALRLPPRRMTVAQAQAPVLLQLPPRTNVVVRRPPLLPRNQITAAAMVLLMLGEEQTLLASTTVPHLINYRVPANILVPFTKHRNCYEETKVVC